MSHSKFFLSSYRRHAAELVLLTMSGLNSPVAYALEWGLFGNVTYRDNTDQDFNSDPIVASLDLYAADQFTDKWSGLIEGVVARADDFNEAEIERVSLKYTFTEKFALSAGRFHTPLGYWNTTYHHGQRLFDTAERPFFLEFEDSERGTGVLPMHTVAMRASGKWELNAGSYDYDLLVGNAHRLDSTEESHDDEEGAELDPRYRLDERSQLSTTLRGKFTSIDNSWQLSIFGRDHTILDNGRISDGALAGRGNDLFQQQILGADTRFEKGSWEFIAEYFYIRNKEKFADKNSHNSHAYYAQLAYKISSNLKGVYRYSRLDFEDDDSYYQLLAAQDVAHHVFTLRYDINLNHTIKLEYDAIDSKSSDANSADIYRLQWSFHFF